MDRRWIKRDPVRATPKAPPAPPKAAEPAPQPAPKPAVDPDDLAIKAALRQVNGHAHAAPTPPAQPPKPPAPPAAAATPQPQPTPQAAAPAPEPAPQPAPQPQPEPEPVVTQPEIAPEPELKPEPLVLEPEPAPKKIASAPQAAAQPAGQDEAYEPGSLWSRLATFEINEKHLETNRIVTASRQDPAHATFDVLRTKILQTLRDNGWTRIAVTSPNEGCGKTFVSVNLTLSLSRQLNTRAVLLDFDMRRPSVSKVLGFEAPAEVGAFLRCEVEADELLLRPGANRMKIGENIAVGASSKREDYASELLQQPIAAEMLDDLEEELEPDVMIFDMPPALVNDDVLAARQLYDAVLIVVGGGITKPEDVRAVEQRLGADTPLLGIVLNQAEGIKSDSYSY